MPDPRYRIVLCTRSFVNNHSEAHQRLFHLLIGNLRQHAKTQIIKDQCVAISFGGVIAFREYTSMQP
jgi:hypothetical protein